MGTGAVVDSGRSWKQLKVMKCRSRLPLTRLSPLGISIWKENPRTQVLTPTANLGHPPYSES